MPKNPSFEKLKSKIPDSGAIDYLIESLSGSDFNSLMLEIFRQRADQISPADLLRDFEKNRFTQPTSLDPILLLEAELDWLKKASLADFTSIILSPVSPLGTCSVVSKTNQNNLISALRNTEVVADATNVLALQLALNQKRNPEIGSERLATVHRHVRAQHYENPNFTAHFGIFCLASAGKDRGNFDFELEEANRHLSLILDILGKHFSKEQMVFKFFLRDENPKLKIRLEEKENCWSAYPVTFETDSSKEYYSLFQFKVYVKIGDVQIDFADGGPVDWVAKLTGNQKMRSFISGIGLELVLKLAGKAKE
ncbi:hypothetical protein [Algoriphagus sp. A40]|uniref:hypothetical protein n=1 Tax=Algoriphagus sp. A40 TaxID=1945863 RepID=UPI00098664B3|nr:hypothetical protein [Algoriphagus sp. A40]OOG74810.1 hypothetical protein B0E43_10510 [Algoriphagus sp. A40]